MSGRGTDIRRLNELAGSNVEFREFGASMDAGSSEWSLLNAVFRSVEPSKTVTSAEGAGNYSPNDSSVRETDWSMLTSISMPPPRMDTEAQSVPEPIPEKTFVAARPTAEATAAKPSFGHLFRKAASTPLQDTQRTDLVQLLKAISRCR